MEKNIKRSDIIKELIDNDIKSIFNDFNENDDVSYITDILTYGFNGYENFTNDELQTEYKESFSPDEDIIVIDD